MKERTIMNTNIPRTKKRDLRVERRYTKLAALLATCITGLKSNRFKRLECINLQSSCSEMLSIHRYYPTDQPEDKNGFAIFYIAESQNKGSIFKLKQQMGRGRGGKLEDTNLNIEWDLSETQNLIRTELINQDGFITSGTSLTYDGKIESYSFFHSSNNVKVFYWDRFQQTRTRRSDESTPFANVKQFFFLDFRHLIDGLGSEKGMAIFMLNNHHLIKIYPKSGEEYYRGSKDIRFLELNGEVIVRISSSMVSKNIPERHGILTVVSTNGLASTKLVQVGTLDSYDITKNGSPFDCQMTAYYKDGYFACGVGGLKLGILSINVGNRQVVSEYKPNAVTFSAYYHFEVKPSPDTDYYDEPSFAFLLGEKTDQGKGVAILRFSSLEMLTFLREEFTEEKMIISKDYLLLTNIRDQPEPDKHIKYINIVNIASDQNCLETKDQIFLSNNCEKCKPNYHLNIEETGNGKCVSTCPLNKLDAQRCHTNSSCLSLNCFKCKDFSTNQCQDCKEGYELLSFTQNCKYKCAATPSMGWSQATNSCSVNCQIDHYCKTCSDFPLKCSNCEFGYKINNNYPTVGLLCERICPVGEKSDPGNENNCILECKKGEAYEEATQKCQPCGVLCLSCSDFDLACEQCQEKMAINEGQNTHCRPDNDKRIILTQTADLIKSQKSINLVFDTSLFDLEANELQEDLSVMDQFSKTEPMKVLNGLIVKVRKTQDGGYTSEFDLASIKLKTNHPKIIEIKINLNTEIKNGEIEVHISHLNSIIAQDYKSGEDPLEYPLFTPNVTLVTKISGINYYPQSKSVEDSLKTTATSISTTTASLAGMTAILALPSFFLLMKIIQYIDYTFFINVQLPQNTQVFLKYFDNGFLRIIPPILPDFLSRYTEDFNCLTDHKFLENEVSCLLYENVGGQIVQLLAVVLIKGALSFILYHKYWKPDKLKIEKGEVLPSLSASIENIEVEGTKKEKITQSYLYKIYCFLSLGFTFNMLSSLVLDFLISSMVNISKASFGNWYLGINVIASVIVVVVFIAAGVWIFMVSIRIQKLKNGNALDRTRAMSKYKSWLFVEEGLKKEKTHFILHNYAYSFLREIMIAGSLTLFMSLPSVQATLCLLIQIFYLVINVVYRPSEVTRENVMSIVREILYTVVLLFMTILALNPGMDEEAKYKNMGWPLIAFMSLVMLTAFLEALRETLVNSWGVLKLIYRRLLSKKQGPVDQNDIAKNLAKKPVEGNQVVERGDMGKNEIDGRVEDIQVKRKKRSKKNRRKSKEPPKDPEIGMEEVKGGRKRKKESKSKRPIGKIKAMKKPRQQRANRNNPSNVEDSGLINLKDLNDQQQPERDIDIRVKNRPKNRRKRKKHKKSRNKKHHRDDNSRKKRPSKND